LCGDHVLFRLTDSALLPTYFWLIRGENPMRAYLPDERCAEEMRRRRIHSWMMFRQMAFPLKKSRIWLRLIHTGENYFQNSFARDTWYRATSSPLPVEE
jgi:hypothetical protein